VGGLLLPFVSGGGALVRAAVHADDVADAARAVNTAANAAQAANQTANAAQAANRASEAAQAANRIGDLAQAGNRAQNASNAGQRIVVIGENMRRRVVPYAVEHGYDVIPRGRGATVADNVRWVQEEIAQGTRFIDIGPDFASRAATEISQGAPRISRWYNAERQALRQAGNPMYQRVYRRFGRVLGGVFGLDW
jgi:hypothetical protein